MSLSLSLLHSFLMSPSLSLSSRAGETDVHVTEPPDKNEFLSDLDKMEEEEGKEEEGEGEGDGGTAVEAAPQLYPDLESSVEVWSDFLRVHLHPKSLLMVPRHFHNEYVSEWRVLGRSSRVSASCYLKQAAHTNATPPFDVIIPQTHPFPLFF